ncbi:MAG: hypothetical protein WD904_05675 [Dehalococcoidia bacterium]
MMVTIGIDGSTKPTEALTFIQREGRIRWYLCGDCQELVGAVDDAETAHQCGADDSEPLSSQVGQRMEQRAGPAQHNAD